MNRREFLRDAGLLAALIGVPVTITSCGSDDEGEPNGPEGPGDETGTATGDHTHSATITRAELDAGNSITVTFSGSGHTHEFTLTADEVQMIAAGTRVQKVDFTAPVGPAHPHTYTFN
jgi:hypothetical protein